MEVVGRYGMSMVGGWTDGGSSEECKLRAIRQRDKERGRQ